MQKKLLDYTKKRSRKSKDWGPEHYTQKAFMKWLRMQYPKIKAFAIPNGVHCSISQRKKMLDEGMLPGVLDVFIPYANSNHPGLFVEFKHGYNKLTDEQKDFKKAMEDCGYKCVVCWDVDSAMNIVNEYMGGGVKWQLQQAVLMPHNSES